MKKSILLLCILTGLSGCDSSSSTYRLRVIKNKKIMTVTQETLEGMRVGDTVELDYNADFDRWRIDAHTPYLQDTVYLNTTDTLPNGPFVVNKKIAVIEEIIH